MTIKEIIDVERVNLEKIGARFGPMAYEMIGILNRIEAKVTGLLYPTVQKIWIDKDRSLRIDFLGNWHISMQEDALYDLIEDGLTRRIADLEAQVAFWKKHQKTAVDNWTLEAQNVKCLEERVTELEAQLPKTVKAQFNAKTLSYRMFCTCGNSVLIGAPYCAYCGSKLDWDSFRRDE